jgi:hypothetical protein
MLFADDGRCCLTMIEVAEQSVPAILPPKRISGLLQSSWWRRRQDFPPTLQISGAMICTKRTSFGHTSQTRWEMLSTSALKRTWPSGGVAKPRVYCLTLSALPTGHATCVTACVTAPMVTIPCCIAFTLLYLVRASIPLLLGPFPGLPRSNTLTLEIALSSMHFGKPTKRALTRHINCLRRMRRSTLAVMPPLKDRRPYAPIYRAATTTGSKVSPKWIDPIRIAGQPRPCPGCAFWGHQMQVPWPTRMSNQTARVPMYNYSFLES